MYRAGITLFACALLFGLAPFGAHAAAIFGGSASISMDMDPQFPAPFSTITITPQSSLVPLERSDVTVSANGVVVSKGSGSQAVPIALGAAGKTTVIKVSVSLEGSTYEKSFSVTPQDLTLVIEPTATTHPFYDGASLVPANGHVRIIALADFHNADGSRIPASSLSYVWHFGDQLLSAQSGIGRMVLDATAPVRYRDATVSVTVQSVDQTAVAGKSIAVSPQDPHVFVYENDPLLGPDFDNALSGNASISGGEQTFRVVPYFFSSFPSIAWTVNSVASGADKDITLRPTGTGAGTATVAVTAKKDDVFQSASQSLSVSFGASQPLGIFGL